MSVGVRGTVRDGMIGSMNDDMREPVSEGKPHEVRPDDSNAVMQALLGRHSVGPRYLREPGPSEAQLLAMAEAALHAPDHAQLVPFAFRAVLGEARQGMAELYRAAAREAGKDEEAVALDGERALAAPVTVAVIARIDLGHMLVPSHEQWIAIGGAISQFMLAAQALGFAGKLLSGNKARSRVLNDAFCGAGETLVGWIALGTPTLAPAPKHRKPPASEVLTFWTPPGA
ncbi:MAG: Nitroreductase family protein [Rhizobacter sp.]|nr:Nitroreductase family protein [Rhizobacter sp.]